MIEIKYRGYLTKIRLGKLLKNLNQNWELINSGYEKVVFFDTSIFPQIGDFATGFSRVSLKSNQNGAVFRIKVGDPSDVRRNEIEVPIKKKHCPNLIFILNRLGLVYGYFRPAYRQDFRLKSITISVKTKCVMGDHFEIQLKKGANINDPDIELLKRKFRLRFWSKEKYSEKIHEKMKRYPAVNVWKSNIWTE